MNRAFLLGFGIPITLEILFFAALNFFDDWTLRGMPMWFVGTAFFSGAAYLGAVSSFKIDVRKQAILFWSIAIALRLLALPLVPGDDLYRYQWEAKVQRAGFNPYFVAPSDSKLDDLRRDFPDAAKINHPELSAIDPPGAELLFKFLNGVTDRPLFYKIIFVLADLGVAALLLRLIGGEGRYGAAAWYAWNPLVVYSFAGAAHFDSVMVLAMVGGVLALTKSTSETEFVGQWLWAIVAALLLGLAISLNLVAAALILLFVFALRWRAIALAVAALVPVVLSVPFDFQKVWNSLIQIAQLPRLNDLFWWLAESVWDNPHQRNFHYYPILIACVIGVSVLFVRDWKRGVLWALGTVMVLSPVLHPWNCVCILPLATWRRAYAWFVLSITLFSYYLLWDERLLFVPWQSPLWMREMIIIPVLSAMIMLAARKKTEVAAS